MMGLLSAEDKTEIAELVRQAVASKPECLCDLRPETRIEVGHFFGRLKDLGDGNLNKGIELFSRALSMLVSVKRCGEKIGGTVAVLVAVALLSGIGTLIIIGVKQSLKGAP